jgi:hypothetical protein
MVQVNEENKKAIVYSQVVIRVAEILNHVIQGELSDIQPQADGTICSADEIKSVLSDALTRIESAERHPFLPYAWVEFNLTELAECSNVIWDAASMMYPDLAEYPEEDVFIYSGELMDAVALLKGQCIVDEDELIPIPDEYWNRTLNNHIEWEN